MADMRIRDYKRYNAPMKVALPINQLPKAHFLKYFMKGQTDLEKFFASLDTSESLEKQSSDLKGEPRYFSKIIDMVAQNKNSKQNTQDEWTVDILRDMGLKQFESSETVQKISAEEVKKYARVSKCSY